MVRIAYETDFPYFEAVIDPDAIINTGPNVSLSSVKRLKQLESSILTSLELASLIEKDVCKKVDSPLEVISVFKLLQIPYEIYPIYQELVHYHPKYQSSQQETRTVASVCLLLSKIFVSPSNDFVNDFYSKLYSLKCTQIPNYPYGDFLVCKHSFENRLRGIGKMANQIAKANFDQVTSETDFPLTRNIPKAPDSINYEIKSYIGEDTQGLKNSHYQISLLKLATYFGIDPKTLESDLRDLERYLEAIISFSSNEPPQAAAS